MHDDLPVCVGAARMMCALLGVMTTAVSFVLADAITTTVVPCYTAPTYSVTNNNTQFIVSNCDGRGQTAYFSTFVTINLGASSAGWSNLSVTVVNSVSASVRITTTTSQLSMADLSILVDNVTNPSSPNGNVAATTCQLLPSSYAWCMPILLISNVAFLVRPVISITNTAVLRNVTNVVALNSWTSIYLGRMHLENVTYSGSVMPCVSLDAASQSTMIRTNITMSNISVIASGSFPRANIVYPLVFNLNRATVSFSNILIDGLLVTDDPNRGSNASGPGIINAIVVAAYLSNETSVVVSNSAMNVVTLRSGILVYTNWLYEQQASFLRVANCCMSAKAGAYFHLIEFQSFLLGGGVGIYDTEVYVLANATSTSTTVLLYLPSISFSTADEAHLTIVNSQLHAPYSGQLISLERPLSNSTVVVYHSSASTTRTTPLDHGVLYFSMPVESTTFDVVNLTCRGGKTHIEFANVIDQVSILIANCSFLNPSRSVLRFSDSFVSQLVVILSNTSITLIPATAFFEVSDYSTLSSSTFTMNVTMDLRQTQHNTSTADHWDLMYMENSYIQDGSLLNVTVALVSNTPVAGRLLFMSNMMTSSNSVTLVNAYPSYDVTLALASSEHSPAFVNVSATSIDNSSVIVVLPQILQWHEGATPQVARFYDTTVTNGGQIHFSGTVGSNEDSVSTLRMNHTKMAPIILFKLCTFSNGASLRISSILLEEDVRAKPDVVSRSGKSLARFETSLIDRSTWTLENITVASQLSVNREDNMGYLVVVSNGTILTGETTVQFRFLNLTSCLILSTDRSTSWWRSTTSASSHSRITLSVAGLHVVSITSSFVFDLGGNVSAGSGIELLMSNSTLYGASVITLDSLAMLGTAASPAHVYITGQSCIFDGTTSDAFISMRSTFVHVVGAALVNVTLSLTTVTTRSATNIHCSLSSNCTAIVAKGSNNAQLSIVPTLSVTLDSASLIGPLTLLLQPAGGVTPLSRVDVYCSRWGRHPFSPLTMMSPHSGPTAMNSGLTFFGHYLHDPTSSCLLPLKNPSSTVSDDSQTSLITLTATIALSESIEAPQTTTDTITRSFVLTKSATIGVPPVPTTSIAEQFFASVGAVTIASGVSSAASSAVGTALVRTAFTAQLADCAGGSIDSIFSGDNGGNNFFDLQIGDEEAPGQGYRSSLVGLLVVLTATTLFGAVVVLVLLLCPCGRIQRRRTLRSATASGALPGWWLAGPCAAAVGPLLSSGISLASVSTWSTPAVDVAILLVAFATAIMSSSWSVLALLKPAYRGFFVCETVGPAPTHQLEKHAPSVVSWLLEGGYLWAVDPLLTKQPLAPIDVPLRDTAQQQYIRPAERMYPHAYGSLFTSMKPNHYWHFLLDMAANVAAGFLAAVPAMVAKSTDSDHVMMSNACNGALHATTVVQLIFAAYFVARRPVAVRWELIAGACMATLGAVNAVLSSVQATSLASGIINEWGNAVQSFQLAASGLAILCAVSECLLTLLVLKHRRTLLDDDADPNPVFASPITILSLSSPPSTPHHFSSIVHSESVSFQPQSHSTMSIINNVDNSPLTSVYFKPTTASTLSTIAPRHDRLGQQPLYHHGSLSLLSRRLALEALAVLVQQAAQAPRVKQQC
ncbi:membrane-associated protein, putative [Bodo saltans]|uniref:Membrane-associated protein, putative n=1 Tax=Bodo saltans TaxID=75058 RepID=A0A0S4IQ90_BODSA|nr:membrane-associated protein, putative [Bodo saltans]|eukprot:CUF22998.1 membrane-associated protein, putative [Bodo saltans]